MGRMFSVQMLHFHSRSQQGPLQLTGSFTASAVMVIGSTTAFQVYNQTMGDAVGGHKSRAGCPLCPGSPEKQDLGGRSRI